MSFSINTVYNFCNTFKIAIVFTFFYVVVNGIDLLVNGFKYPTTPLFTFLTAWFNLSEDYSYSSFYVGFLSNFIPPLICIIIYEIYLMRLPIKEKLYFVNVEVVFTLGVFSTYVVSAVTWQVFHYPGSGSSILGFTLLMLVIFYSWVNVRFLVKMKLEKWSLKKEIHIKKEEFKYNILMVIFVGLYSFPFLLYIINNSSWIFHVFGFIIFIVFVFIFKFSSIIYRSLRYTDGRAY